MITNNLSFATISAFVLFVIAKVSGITAMVVMFAGNRELSKFLLTSAVVTLAGSIACCLYELYRVRRPSSSSSLQAENLHEKLKHLAEMGTLEETLRSLGYRVQSTGKTE